jgi:hypothetical protein
MFLYFCINVLKFLLATWFESINKNRNLKMVVFIFFIIFYTIKNIVDFWFLIYSYKVVSIYFSSFVSNSKFKKFVLKILKTFAISILIFGGIIYRAFT